MNRYRYLTRLAKGAFCLLIWAGFQRPAWAEISFDEDHPPTEAELIAALKLPPRDVDSDSKSIGPLRTRTNATLLKQKSQKSLDSAHALVDIPFANGSQALDATAKEYLRVVGRTIEALPDQNFIIEGHASRTGPPEKNRELATDRARSALGFLVDEFSVDTSRVKAEGVGTSDQELIDRAHPAGKRNRSVRIITYR